MTECVRFDGCCWTHGPCFRTDDQPCEGWPCPRAPRCHHCGKQDEADGDHTCPCPYSDMDCPDHQVWENEGGSVP